MAHDPKTEILPPVADTQYAPAEKPASRDFSEWDPRSAPGTYFLLAVNIGVFVWMTLHGVGIRGGTSEELMHYGANNASQIIDNGEWWRLLTAIFVHIGLLHVASNMWCLWNLGLLGEPLLGPWGILAVYLLTGVAGNVLSILFDVWGYHHGDLMQYSVGVGAGASGAVFGIAGILIILLSNRRLPIPWTELARLRRSVIQFAGINLAIGLATKLGGPVRIDNAAHLGGFISGMILGPGLVAKMTAGRVRYLARQRIVFIAAAFVLALLGYLVANFK